MRRTACQGRTTSPGTAGPQRYIYLSTVYRPGHAFVYAPPIMVYLYKLCCQRASWGEAALPQVRLTTLIEVGTRVPLAWTQGPREAETAQAQALHAYLGPDQGLQFPALGRGERDVQGCGHGRGHRAETMPHHNRYRQVIRARRLARGATPPCPCTGCWWMGPGTAATGTAPCASATYARKSGRSGPCPAGVKRKTGNYPVRGPVP